MNLVKIGQTHLHSRHYMHTRTSVCNIIYCADSSQLLRWPQRRVDQSLTCIYVHVKHCWQRLPQRVPGCLHLSWARREQLRLRWRRDSADPFIVPTNVAQIVRLLLRFWFTAPTASRFAFSLNALVATLRTVRAQRASHYWHSFRDQFGQLSVMARRRRVVALVL